MERGMGGHKWAERSPPQDNSVEASEALVAMSKHRVLVPSAPPQGQFGRRGGGMGSFDVPDEASSVSLANCSQRAAATMVLVAGRRKGERLCDFYKCTHQWTVNGGLSWAAEPAG
jgi:hypothetical protein